MTKIIEDYSANKKKKRSLRTLKGGPKYEIVKALPLFAKERVGF